MDKARDDAEVRARQAWVQSMGLRPVTDEHRAEVTARRLTEALEHWTNQLSPDERKAAALVIEALDRLARKSK